MIYINKQTAQEMGFTYEGKLFGVPAWFDSERDDAMVTPKFQPFHYWCQFADMCYEGFSYLLRADQLLVTPIRVTGPIVKF